MARYAICDLMAPHIVRAFTDSDGDGLPEGHLCFPCDDTVTIGMMPDGNGGFVAQPTPKRLIDKSLVLSRLTDAQLDAALSMMSNRQKERWRMPGRPDIYVDDPELLGLLAAVGADPDTVLAAA